VCRDQKWAAFLPRVAGIKRRRWQYWQASTSEFAVARQCFGLGSGGEWRGARGLLIGAARERFNGLHQRESRPGEITARGNGRDYRPELEEGPDTRGPPVSERE
jgi:hypothetical protein